jgi:RNA ligase
MHYEFPVIRDINDVLPAIENSDEFIVVKKDGYTVINYTMLGNDTFPGIGLWCPGCKRQAEHIDMCGSQRCPELESDQYAAIRRECRGLIFCSETGRILSRRYHKFFNMGEREETLKVDLTQPHIVLEKLDGSMVSPVRLHNGAIRWMTKMGITEVALDCEVFVAKNPKYQEAAARAIAAGWTPIFEYVSPKHRIIIPYEENLIVTAMRYTDSGRYLNIAALNQWAREWTIPCVRQSTMPVGDEEDNEGIVIRFLDGHMVKVKTDWYVLRHKSKDAITREKHVISFCINEQVDDVLPFLIEGDRERLIDFNKRFQANIKQVVRDQTTNFKWIRANFDDRKQYAIRFAKDQPHWMRSLMFAAFDGKDIREMLTVFIKSSCGTQTKIEANRHLWGNLKWDYSNNES